MSVCEATRVCATAPRPQNGRWCCSPGTVPDGQQDFRQCRRVAQLASRRLETAANHIQIGERRGDQQPLGILGRAVVADIRESEDALDDADDVFHLGPYVGFGAVLRPRPRIEAAAIPDSAVGEVLRLRGHLAKKGRLALLSPIAPDLRLVAMQEARQDRTVGHVGRRGGGRVDHFV